MPVKYSILFAFFQANKNVRILFVSAITTVLLLCFFAIASVRFCAIANGGMGDRSALS
jgi:hypothetical protein